MRYLFLILWTPAALAAPIYQYDFSVIATDGPLAGQSSSGHVTYEVPDLSDPYTIFLTGVHVYADVPATLDFTWNGKSYGPAEWEFVSLDSMGKVRFGEPGLLTPAELVAHDNAFDFVPGSGDDQLLFSYRINGINWTGTGTFGFAGEVNHAEVLEPRVFALMALALLLLIPKVHRP